MMTSFVDNWKPSIGWVSGKRRDLTFAQFNHAAIRNGFLIDRSGRLHCPVGSITYCRVWEGNNVDGHVNLRATLAKAIRLREEDRARAKRG